MFKIGQKVVCINDKKPSNRNVPVGLTFPILNKTYTIRDIILNKNQYGIVLEEIINPTYQSGVEIAYSLDRFRPVVDSDVLESLLNKIIQEELELEYSY